MSLTLIKEAAKAAIPVLLGGMGRNAPSPSQPKLSTCLLELLERIEPDVDESTLVRRLESIMEGRVEPHILKALADMLITIHYDTPTNSGISIAGRTFASNLYNDPATNRYRHAGALLDYIKRSPLMALCLWEVTLQTSLHTEEELADRHFSGVGDWQTEMGLYIKENITLMVESLMDLQTSQDQFSAQQLRTILMQLTAEWRGYNGYFEPVSPLFSIIGVFTAEPKSVLLLLESYRNELRRRRLSPESTGE